MSAPVLAYDESSLPGTTRRERLELAEELGLALEVRHDAMFDAGDFDQAKVPIVTLQAYELHYAHPLSPDHAQRALGVRHIEAALRAAHEAEIPRVLTVAGFGKQVCDEPHARAVEAFRQVEPLARELGVRVAIELLSPRRAGALTSPDEHLALLSELDAPDVFGPALDTGHLLDAERDPGAVVARYLPALEQLQLRGADSTAPGDLDLTFLESVGSGVRVVSIEHAERIAADAARALVTRVRAAAVFA